MTEHERWEMVCNPKLTRIEQGVDKLMEVVVTGNGKPPLVARVGQIEQHMDRVKIDGTRSRSLKVGPVEINGYALSDVAKVLLLLAFCLSIYLLITDREQRRKIEARMMQYTEQRMGQTQGVP
jgi:hypothetical protein